MKLLLTLFALLFCVVLATSAPLDAEARDKRHLVVGPAPAVITIPLVAPAPLVHGPVVVGPHWGYPLGHGHSVVKYW